MKTKISSVPAVLEKERNSIAQSRAPSDTPYARKMYYNPQYGFNRSINPLAGGYWFERMKADHSRDILLEAKNAIDK